MKRRKLLAASALGWSALAGCVSADGLRRETPTPTPTAPPTALDLLEMAFIGDYTQEEIKYRLDTVLEQYGAEISEDNYYDLGELVLRLGPPFGVPEMIILDCMIDLDLSTVDGNQEKEADELLPEAAVICAVDLGEE